MKTMRLIILGSVASLFVFTSCQRSSLEDDVLSQNTVSETGEVAALMKKNNTGPCNPNAYTITLESRTQVNGYWEWVWSVQNPNPGNGNNGTAQDLSHWGMQFGSCVNWSSVIGAAYSGNGTNWTSFTPSYQSDQSQNCLTTPILKFDFGTSGTAKSYYKLIIDQDVAAGNVVGYYKSGGNCCTFSFTGVGCGGPVEIVE